LTDNSAGLRTAFSSRLSHRELRNSLRESHSFLSLPANTRMESSQGHQFIQQMCQRTFSSVSRLLCTQFNSTL